MKKKSITKTRRIRIIAGKWKGRIIPVVNQLTVRPTTSRIREVLFSWLAPFISNTTICLDCFSGSGALGLESLSRGVKKVTFIEKNYICFKSLRQTIQAFKNNQCEIICSDCRNWLKSTDDTYNIIFLDAPFNNHYITLEVIWLLEQYCHFKKQSWIYIETSNNPNLLNLEHLPKYWFLYRKKATKSLLIYLYYRSVIKNLL